MAGVGIGHDGGVDDDAMNAILVELKVKTEKKNECREKQVGELQGRVCSLFLSFFSSSVLIVKVAAAA
jgi:hypothetical protein